MTKRTFKDEELKPKMVFLLETFIGFEIGMFDMLCMFQLEDLRYAVYNQPDVHKPLFEGDEYLFDEAGDAVDLFLKFRRERQLGFDHECGYAHPLEDDLRPEYDLTKLKRVEPEKVEQMAHVRRRNHLEEYHHHYDIGGEG